MIAMLKTGTLKNERALGFNISQIMQRQNVTVEQLAGASRTPEIRLRAIITGSAGILDEELTTIADKLGVNEQELLKPVADEVLQEYNIHCMGTATSAKEMNKILDKVDMYVRLLNVQSDN